MGIFMKQHDIYVGSMLDELNIRFAPSQASGDSPVGGIDEMAALQKEFRIFKKDRSFEKSVSALNFGAWNTAARAGWNAYLATLHRFDSNQGKLDGDAAIVQALAKNLAASKPLPVYFTSHDMRASAANNRVLITAKARPLFYLDVDYLVVSFPMQPHPTDTPAKPTRKKKK
jgi:hypothetical protein